MRVEHFDQLGEVCQRPGKAVDLINHNDIDLAGSNIVQQPLQVGTVGRASGIASIVISGADWRPAGVRLALDVSRRSLILRVQGVEVLVEALVCRYPRIDGTS